MSIRIGDHEFDQVSYDESADVLYLKNERHGEGVSTQGTAEGHAVRLDLQGNVVGMTIVNARWLIERDGAVVISVPKQRIEILARDVGFALERSIGE